MKRFSNSVLILAFFLLAGVVEGREPKRSQLTVEVADGGAYVFEVELANTNRRRRRGLMFRESLGDNYGMLFDFKKEIPVSMWMSNTSISLDMLFISADGRIASIVESAMPLSRDSIRSEYPVRAVLEVNAGTASKFGIKAGDQVRHSIFNKKRLNAKRRARR